MAVAEHSEDGQKLVIYQALYGDFKVYARPLEMFVSEVDHEKYPDAEQKYRFERIEFGATESKVEEVAASESKADCKESQKVKVPTHSDVNTQEDVGVVVSEDEVAEEEQPEPGLLGFLDEGSWDEKYNILVSLRDKMSDKLVDALAVAMDVVIPEGPLDKRYEQLKICVRTRQKYESQHLR